jgi:amino acid permease
VLTALILISSYAVAMTVSSLDRVLAFVGSTGSTAISFILPGIFYHRMTRPGGLLPRTPEDGFKDDDSDIEDSTIVAPTEDDDVLSLNDVAHTTEADTKRARRKRLRRSCAVSLVVYGFVIMVVCLSVNVIVGRGEGGH